MFVNAPAGDAVKPVPFIVSASAVDNVIPFRSSAAPAVTEVIPPVVPNGVFVPSPAAPSLSMPALTVAPPEYVLFPESINVPVPFLVTATEVAVPLLMIPL